MSPDRSPVVNALTIDLEDWYQGLSSTSQQSDRWPGFEDRIVPNAQKILSILAEAKVKATFFTLGYVADQFPELVRAVADAGHEIALHGYYHRRVFQMTPDAFRAELLHGRSAVEKASGTSLAGYRAPMFSINRSSLWAFDVLQEQGFLYDSSVFPTRNMLYGFPDAPRQPYRPCQDSPFTEFPMSTVTMLGLTWPISGGFYLRSMPYALFRRAVARLNAQGQSLVLYLHPWELDLHQPRLNLRLKTLRERFTHYWGRRTIEQKFRSLLKDFSFSRMIDLYHSGLE